MRSIMEYITTMLGLASITMAIDLDLTQESSVDTALSSIAHDMMQYYTGNQTGQTPGLLPGPCTSLDCYYWWVSGAMWASLINYQQYTGDTSYQSTVLQALAFQTGPENNYNPPNQSRSISVDDQSFWALAALEAAEAGLPDADDGETPSWLTLAENAFNFQVALWNNKAEEPTCNDGGLRWQIYSFNTGYEITNAIGNANFFQLAARLARYTGNTTYVDWANTVYTWLENSPLLETSDGHLYVWDNVDAGPNCSAGDVQRFVWSYAYGSLLVGSATMYNITNDTSTWQNRTTTILDGMQYLMFPTEYGGTTLVETLCESSQNCNNDQYTFKALSARWMAVTSVLAPFTRDTIAPLLEGSAKAAAGQCVGGDSGRLCGAQWFSTEWDGSEGVGQQMSALAVIGATRIMDVKAPLTGASGGSGTATNGSGTNSNGTSTNGDGSSPVGSNVNGAGSVILSRWSIAVGAVAGLLVHCLL